MLGVHVQRPERRRVNRPLHFAEPLPEPLLEQLVVNPAPLTSVAQAPLRFRHQRLERQLETLEIIGDFQHDRFHGASSFVFRNSEVTGSAPYLARSPKNKTISIAYASRLCDPSSSRDRLSNGTRPGRAPGSPSFYRT